MGFVGKLSRWMLLWKNQFSIKNIINEKCEDSNSVLLIKLDAIGDFIIWLDSAKEYRSLYPGREITLLCNALCKGIAEATGYFDKVMVLDIKKYETDTAYRETQNKVLLETAYGLLIQTAYSRTQHMDMLAAVIPAHKKIAFQADESRSNVSRRLLSKKNKIILDSIYDQLIPATRENIMELQRNKEFIVGLGKKDFKSSIPKLPNIKGVEIPPCDYFLVFPGASTKIKTWKPERFAETINYIQSKKKWLCLICGGGSEQELFEVIKDNVNDPNRIVNYCGKTSLVELIELVRSAKLVLSNDTSGIHYAAATGTPGICPFGEYNYGRFLPYESDAGAGTVNICNANMSCKSCASNYMTLRCIVHILKSGRYECIDFISAGSVIEKIEQL